MIISLEEFIYFNNTNNYIKNLSNKNISKDFNEIIERKKNISLIQIFLFILIIIIFEFISYNNKISYIILFISIFGCINLFMKIIILKKFSNSYYSFIKLCEFIVKFDNKIKEKIKIKSLLKSNNNGVELILIAIMNKINTLINLDTTNNNINNNNKKEIGTLFNEYQIQKQKLFKYIFFNYEKEYLIRESYINKFIKIFLNYSNHYNTQLNHIINIFKEGIQKLDIEEINFDLYFTNNEKYINKNIINNKEKKKKELNESLYNLFESNYKLNEYYIKLIKEINSDINNFEKINEIIEYIIEKKKLSINLLEQINTKINKENENKIINNNENKTKNDIQRSTNNFNKKDDNEISLSDIQLNNYTYNSHNKIENINEYKNNNKTKIKSNFDLINEQKKIETLKSDFIEELNKYCKSKQNLNNSELKENKKEDDNKINKEIEINNKMKMDFAKSLTMCLKNNKNFKFNLKEENNKDN